MDDVVCLSQVCAAQVRRVVIVTGYIFEFQRGMDSFYASVDSGIVVDGVENIQLMAVSVQLFFTG